MKSLNFAYTKMIIIFILLNFYTGDVFAEHIYSFENEEGELIFTDTPTHKGFKIFLKDIKIDNSLRTAFRISGRYENFSNIIKEMSNKYGVNENLVKAVIQAESGYNPSAVSHKGAAGLMQLMPQTAKGLGVVDRFSPKDNIEGGVKYLKFLLGVLNNDTRLTLAAYNAGLGAVKKYNGIPPYKETVDYVNKIMSAL